MPTKSFSRWNGENGILHYIKTRTNCNPFSGCGINIRYNKETAILRSVDNTYYYDDDLTDEDIVQYTLFGHNGDQYINEKKFNKALLDNNKIKNIYLYRCIYGGKIKEYIWYGKYEIIGMFYKQHQGKDNIQRRIILLNLRKISD